MNSDYIILLVDDDPVFRDGCGRFLQDSGFQVQFADNGQDGLKKLEESAVTIVFVDYKMPGMSGLEFIRIVHEKYPNIDILMVTGYATIENAVEAVKLGAYDYIAKPFYPDKLLAIIRKIHEKRNILSHTRLNMNANKLSFIGASPAMRKIFDIVLKIAPTDSTVLIMGESGTGKELVAQGIQANSTRSEKPFMIMDCGSLVENLFESELFGHVKGAFTGAVAHKPGAFEMANGGTFFFDEIGNISPNVQAKILRAIQEKEIRRIGSTETIHVDVRVIAATNKDLRREVEEGRFREDLFYRLSVIPIYLPPLRDRKEDIPSLIEFFISKHSHPRKRMNGIQSEALDLLTQYDWPGNIRELENLIERACVIEESDIITSENLPSHIYSRRSSNVESLSLAQMEKRHIKLILVRNNWNISATAKILGIDRKTLYDKIRKYKLKGR
ncbi:sigma-54-dependent Fis family transcriptional regulator [candidate division KSB1 bacterium]|nr:sigma-54-dependent Fis family transcriptional regulator [candidate division KSB1 bacterium]